MPRGGPRPGSGRKKGSRNKATLARIDAASAAVAEAPPPDDRPTDPLSVGLRALARLEAAGEWSKAGALAVRLAKFTSQPLRPTKLEPAPHPAQRLPDLPLFDVDAARREGFPKVNEDGPASEIARRLLKN